MENDLERDVKTKELSRRKAILVLARIVPTLSIAAALGGCAVPGSGPAPSRVRLTPAETFPEGVPSVGWSLLVEEPTATLSINTARVALLESNQSYSYMSNLEWASRAPEMVMELLTDSFKNSNRILTVGDRRSRIRPDFDLESQLTAFQIERLADNKAIVKVGLTVSLLQRPSRRFLASNSFDAAVDIDQLKEETLVRAFDTALRSVMVDVVEWTLKTGAAA